MELGFANFFFIEMGFEKKKNCNCVYHLIYNIIVFAYVDHFAVFIKNSYYMNHVFKILNENFTLKI